MQRSRVSDLIADSSHSLIRSNGLHEVIIGVQVSSPDLGLLRRDGGRRDSFKSSRSLWRTVDDAPAFASEDGLAFDGVSSGVIEKEKPSVASMCAFGGGATAPPPPAPPAERGSLKTAAGTRSTQVITSPVTGKRHKVCARVLLLCVLPHFLKHI